VNPPTLDTHHHLGQPGFAVERGRGVAYRPRLRREFCAASLQRQAPLDAGQPAAHCDALAARPIAPRTLALPGAQGSHPPRVHERATAVAAAVLGRDDHQPDALDGWQLVPGRDVHTSLRGRVDRRNRQRVPRRTSVLRQLPADVWAGVVCGLWQRRALAARRPVARGVQSVAGARLVAMAGDERDVRAVTPTKETP
jgi:hypothetical protein